jgi:pyruvate formate lyase activating enzyme
MDKRTFMRMGICGVAGAMICPFEALASPSGTIDPTGLPETANPEFSGDTVYSGKLWDSSKPWKWSKLAMYQVETPRGIRCQICPNECTLQEGEVSDCHNRKVFNGKLYTMAYGNPCAVHIDPVEKKPMNHFKPGSTAFSIATAGCNLACLNCQNWTISQTSPDKTENYDMMPDQVVAQAQKYNCNSIAYTYSEPITFYEYVLDTGKIAHDEGFSNILVSAGYIHQEPLVNLCKVIDGANIDLKSMDDSIYLKLNAGKLEPVLNCLKTMKDEGVWLEITNLVVPSWTDDLDMIKRMCQWLVTNGFDNTPLHFSRFHPQYKLQRLAATPVQTLENAWNIARAEGLKFVYIGNVPGNHATDTICPNCKEIVVERSGYTIKKYKISKDSRCMYCNTLIPGVWN